jgi:recombination protein RecA
MDPEEKKHKLEMVVAALHKRWGSRAVRRLRPDQRSLAPRLSTGFPELDQALGTGGVPGGRISEIIGIPTSGMATIALKIVASIQEQAHAAVYIDLARSFDPDYAARCGLSLGQLVLVRPVDARQALAILQDFIHSGLTRILVFDTPLDQLTQPPLDQGLAPSLDRLIAPLGRTDCVLLFLTPLSTTGPLPSSGRDMGPKEKAPTINPEDLLRAGYPNNSPLPHYAAVRLLVQRERWIYKERDIHGYQAEVLVIKNKLGPTGKRASLAIIDGRV